MLIGLSVNYIDGKSSLAESYTNSVIQAGGTPVMIPVTTNRKALEDIVSQIDGLILTGGGDIYSPLFGEELHPAVTDYNTDRDTYDISLLRMAADRQMPVLGICRGHQVINVTFGGTLIQDIPSQAPASNIVHRQKAARDITTHTATINPDTILYKALNCFADTEDKPIAVNSLHHQAIKDIAPSFRATAYSPDGIVEAIESTEGKSIIGVQWHPENLAMAGNDAMLNLFEHLTCEAGLYSRAKALHKNIYSIDSHVDTPLYFHYGIDIGKRNGAMKVNPKDLGASGDTPVNYTVKVDVPKMEEGMLDAVFMVAYLYQGARTAAALKDATKRAVSIINEIKEQVNRNDKTVALAYSVDDLKRNKALGKRTVFIGIENGYALGKDIKNVERFAKMGVRYITLSHNGDNDICDSNIGKGEHNGLSEFGKAVVAEMNRHGVMVDISHTSEKTSFDVLEVSTKPIIASHSSAKALCNHTRNISDSLMKAIAAKGGVVQICLYGGFLAEGRTATVKDACDHIDHIVKTVGIDHVGIGSDFDGGGGIPGVSAANELPQITIELMRRGYSDAQIAKIWGGNLMRVMDIVAL
ncbi:MAG: gamma-glutamyl-gamma-aminobutyrate hydrolase family protein [Dysgonamonadaceae bacterium]|jgi:microsomal dipeptidase-like Zn-dependent dipeptidase/gamma-glutamyl-gamma-aminobutyrate hydrolase PuuD|nr:gamma-glutamyl-gamma-aminobutyrate hydrolase family protein [Dysgonamonadaceae bacterium]